MDQQVIRHLRVLIVLFTILCVLITVFGVLLISKVERMTAVSESLNQKANDIVTATAPLGHEAVNQGVQVLQNVDTKELGKSATNGVKELGATLKDSATDWIKKHPAKPDSSATQP
jgi:predicted PurR-regulated permease PerM